MIRKRIVPALVVAGLLSPPLAEAQRLACGGHRIEWVGGTPGAGLNGTPTRDRPRESAGARSAADGYDPTHYDGAQPTIPEPPGLNRERWDALVFTAWGFPSPDRETLVLHREIVPTIKICLQSADDSNTGERLTQYSDASWWRRQINRWTDLSWNGEIRVAACTGRPPDGWVYVRERESGGLPDSTVASTASTREIQPHGNGRWRYSWIDWNADHVEALDESYFEMVLAHELGHVLGFGHVPPGAGYIMNFGPEGWSEEERSLAQLAYRVGPNVRYPGLVRTDAEDGAGEDHPDRAALTALYDATDGENWNDSSNWGTNKQLVYWHGVVTGDAERVIELDLHVNNLAGSIPAELEDLSQLRILRFTENNLTGPIPPELGHLADLNWLLLRDNGLTGSIPRELGDLSALRLMELGSNDLSGSIPPEFGNLAALQGMRLESNNLSGSIPPELGRLSNLQWLFLRDNDLTGPIPPELGSLSKVGLLELQSNNLSGPVPPEFGQLTRLKSLYLSDNRLTGPLPSSFTNLRRLFILNISNNAGLCAPADDAFQDWLATLNSFEGTMCGAAPVAVLPGIGLTVMGLSLAGLGIGILLLRRSQVGAS